MKRYKVTKGSRFYCNAVSYGISLGPSFSEHVNLKGDSMAIRFCTCDRIRIVRYNIIFFTIILSRFQHHSVTFSPLFCHVFSVILSYFVAFLSSKYRIITITLLRYHHRTIVFSPSFWFDPRLGQYSFRGLMIVIATGFIPLSPLSVVSKMVMWESSQ